jgi:hypothetical protein
MELRRGAGSANGVVRFRRLERHAIHVARCGVEKFVVAITITGETLSA